MKQSKWKSFVEAVANTIVGFGFSMLFAPLIYWVLGMKASMPQLTSVVGMFSIVSILRNYIVRRWFNKWFHKKKSTEQ